MIKNKKRLIRKASLELYHGTSLDSFENICSSGSITPFGEHGSGGIGTEGFGGGSERKDGIYLADSDAVAYEYAIRNTWPLGIGIVLRVNIQDISNLEPDFADLEAYYIDDEGNQSDIPKDLSYQDSLSMSGQCVYVGNISISDISGVQFVTERATKYDEVIQPDTWHSLGEAKDIVTKIQN